MVLLEIVGIIAMIFLFLVGIILTLGGGPGNFVILIGAIAYNLITWSMEISYLTLGIVLAIAIAGEVLEYVIGIKAAKSGGASRAGVTGAIIGGLAGAIIGVPVFLIGSLIGMFIGAFLGAVVAELSVEKKPFKHAVKAGIGAFKGRVGAIMVKELLGVVMIIVIVMAAL